MPAFIHRHGTSHIARVGAWALATLLAHAQGVEQARSALLRGDVEAALPVLEKAVKDQPKDAGLHHLLAQAYGRKASTSSMFTAARYAPKARGEWEQAVSLDPSLLEARLSLVEYYAFAPGFMGGSQEKAIQQAQAILARDQVLGHRAMALVYVQQKQLGLAKQEYLEALRKEPNSARAHCFLGRHLANAEKNPEAAMPEFETAVRLDPVDMPAWYHLGRSVSQAGKHLERGEEALRKYLAYPPKLNEPSHADAHCALALIHEKQGKAEAARREYQAALSLDPSLKQAKESLKRLSHG